MLGLSFSAYAGDGITDKEIHIGSWGPQTGPAAPWGTISRGSDAYFKMINKKGGINGRQIVFHHFDDGYNPARTKAGVKQLQEGETPMFAFVGGVGTSPGLAVVDYLMDAKVPWIGPATASEHWVNPPKKYLFTNYAPYYKEAMVLTKYAVETMKKKRIAVVYQNDDYGKGGLKGVRMQLEKNGMKPVLELPMEVKDTDMKPYIFKLKKADVDAVVLWISVGQAVRTIGTAKAMQLSPQFFGTSTVSDFPLMFKISKGLWKGVITASFNEPPESTSPLMMEYKEAFKQFASKDERWGTFFIAGFMFAEPLVEALKRIPHDELTRERLVLELEGLKNFQGIGAVTSYKKFDVKDPRSRQGTNAVYLTECLDNGANKKLTDWIELD